MAIAQHPPADPGGPAGTAGASVVAFRLLAWTAAAATVSVLTVAGTQQAAVQLQVRWDGSDWRLVAPAGGNFAAAAVPAPAVSGYTTLPGR